MGIILTTILKDVNAELQLYAQKTKLVNIRELERAGELSINNERLLISYTDRTGNLRSSVGYVIVDDGKIISLVIKEATVGTDKKAGVKTATDLLKELASQTQGLALIVVAGMNYASQVADRGYDVLDTAEMTTNRILSYLYQKQ